MLPNVNYSLSSLPQECIDGSFVGDKHNFGRRVVRIGNTQFLKPRCIFWEMALLSKDGLLRSYLETLFDKLKLANCFDLIPDHKFDFEDFFGIRGGTVQPIGILNNKADCPDATTYERLGTFFALLMFLGVADLHRENIAYGSLPNDPNTYFYPSDVECIFHNITLPSQSGLLDIWKKLLRQINYEVSSLKCALAFLNGYISTYKGLLSHKNAVRKYITKHQIFSIAPIRVVLRDTTTYSRYLALNNCSESLIKEELEQLDRGDIPAFYTFIGSTQLYYYKHNDQLHAVNLQEPSLCRAFQRWTPGSFESYFGRLSNRTLVLSTAQLVKTLSNNVEPISAKLQHGSFSTTSEGFELDLLGTTVSGAS